MSKAEALSKMLMHEDFSSKVTTSEHPDKTTLEENIYSKAIARGFSLLNVANGIHAWHFQCKSLEIPNRWNMHKALNDLYDSLRELADELIESSVTHLPEGYIQDLNIKFELEVDRHFSKESCLDKLKDMRDTYNEEGKTASKDIALQDIYVKLVQAVNKCLYQII